MLFSKPSTDNKELDNPKSENLSPEGIREILKPIQDPDLGISVVDLGLIYNIENKDGDINIEMTFTTPACPYGPQILEEIKYTLNALDDVGSVNIDVVWDPPWSMERISEETRLEMGMDI